VNYLDKRLSELYAYQADAAPPADLDRFWEQTLQEAAAKPLDGQREAVETLSPYIQAYRVTYHGFDTTPIRAWLLLPSFAMEGQEKLPCMITYHGYSGSKGIPEQHAPWLVNGYAVLAVDVRGQGGETGNHLAQQYGMTRGWITQGILDPYQSYYRAIAVDALQAVEWAAQQPEIDPERLVVSGQSQGGGLALLVGALSRKPVKVIADIPNMCHMDYGIVHSTGSLKEAAEFVAAHPDKLEQVLRTLSYFDMLHLQERIQAPVLMSVGLKDTVCIPETIFSVYNRLSASKQLIVFPFNGHYTSKDHIHTQIEFIRGKKEAEGRSS